MRDRLRREKVSEWRDEKKFLWERDRTSEGERERDRTSEREKDKRWKWKEMFDRQLIDQDKHVLTLVQTNTSYSILFLLKCLSLSLVSFFLPSLFGCFLRWQKQNDCTDIIFHKCIEEGIEDFFRKEAKDGKKNIDRNESKMDTIWAMMKLRNKDGRERNF